MNKVKDFSLEKYTGLLKTIKENGYQTMSVCNYIEYGSQENCKIAIMRHDVDRNINTALEMASIEEKFGVSSTYYFRYPQTFKPDIIKEIEKMGHEVGYHYETLSKKHGDYSKAIKLFEYELSEFNQHFKVSTVCAHGALSFYRSLDLWNHYDYKDYGLIAEAYLSLRGIPYYSDTSRKWRDFNDTDEMINVLTEREDNIVYFLTHPGRWPQGRFQWYLVFGKDIIFNIGKFFGKGFINLFKSRVNR